MLDLDLIARHRLHREPYRWGMIPKLYSRADAAALADSYPHDHFKTVSGYGGEKDYEYEARELVPMGASHVAHAEALSPAWQRLAQQLLTPGYRAAMSTLTGIDLSNSPMEANLFHYAAGACLGAHPDLPDKVVTHVLYFNRAWDRRDGGCLAILRSSDDTDVAALVEPIVGNSAVLVRSTNSWHAVQRVVDGCERSRRSVTVTFYQPGSQSSMWPADDTTPLHRFDPAMHARARAGANGAPPRSLMRRLLGALRR